MSSQQNVEIGVDEAVRRGLSPMRIRVDPRAASMSSRTFPANDVYLKLSGPPGGPLLLMIWDCKGANDVDAALIRSKFVPAWTTELEVGIADRAHVLGRERAGLTFATGSGIARTAWFGFLLTCGAGHALITLGVGGRDNVRVPAADVVSNPAIKRVLETLTIAEA
jgi:hypothetical protein